MLNEVSAVNRYTGDNSTVNFPYGFRIVDQADIEVSLDGSIQTLTTQYSVSGVGNAGGGTVTFVTAPGTGVRVTLLRAQPKDQGSDYQLNEGFPSERVEQDLDKLAMIAQEHTELFSRTLRAPRQDALDMVLPSVASRASNVLGFTAAGLPTAVPLPTAGGGDLSLSTVLSTSSTTARTLAERFAEVYNVKDYGAASDGVTDDTVAIQAAIAAIGSSTAVLLIPGVTVVSTNVTVPANVTLWFLGGGKLSIASAQTITINGPVLAHPMQQIFAGSGTIAGLANGHTIYPNWWKANTTPGTTDMTTAFEAARGILQGAGAGATVRAKLVLLPQQYLITSAITKIESSGWQIEGYGADVLLGGSGSYTAFQFGKDYPLSVYGDRQFNVVVRGLKLSKTGGSAARTALLIIGWDNGKLEDYNASMEYSVSGDIGLRILGHTESTFTNLFMLADKPLVLGKAYASAGSGVDHFNFHNLRLYSTTNANPLITMEAGAVWGTLSFTGNQTWVGGNAGFKLDDSSATANPGNVSFENIRREDNTTVPGTRTSGYTIYVDVGSTYTAQMIAIRNSQMTVGSGAGYTMDGVYLRSTYTRLLMENIFDGGSSGQTMLNVTAGAGGGNIVLTNLAEGNAAMTISGFTYQSGGTVTSQRIYSTQIIDGSVVATANLPAAGAANDGLRLIEDAGAGDRNLIIYGGGQRFRIDGGTNF